MSLNMIDDNDDIIDHDQYRNHERISLDDIINFCFPINIEHPDTTLRLYLLADYGPVLHHHSYLKCLCKRCHDSIRSLLAQKECESTNHILDIVHDHILISPDHIPILHNYLCNQCHEHILHNVHIRSGISGHTIVTDHEISVMCQIEEMNDMISIYIPVHDLSYSDRKQFLERIPKRLRSYRNFTRSDLITLFQPLFPQSDSYIDFYVFSRFVREHRQNAIRSMSNVDYLTKELVKEHRVKVSRRYPVRTDIKGSTDIFQLLHRYSWQITDSHNRHSANTNVRVVIDRPPDSLYQWDGNFVNKLHDSL